MFGLLSLKSNCFVMAIEKSNNDSFLSNIGGTSVSSTPATSSPLKFDFDISQINTAVAKGKGSASDIKSAYELFSTGQTKGRAYGYATDIQRRFSPGLIATYGSSDIRTAAANYLDSVGLPRLAQVVSPVTTTPIDDSNQQFFALPVKPDNTVKTPDNPFELLVDAFTRAFGNAVYNPPLQSQSSGFTGQSTNIPLTESGGGSNIGTFIIIGVVGIIAYFLYKRFV